MTYQRPKRSLEGAFLEFRTQYWDESLQFLDSFKAVLLNLLVEFFLFNSIRLFTEFFCSLFRW